MVVLNKALYALNTNPQLRFGNKQTSELQDRNAQLRSVNQQLRSALKQDELFIKGLNQKIITANQSIGLTPETGPKNLIKKFITNNLTILLNAASVDSLTGLPNRRSFDASLSKAFSEHEKNGVKLCAGMMDMDNFKAVNDLLGHQVGDNVLKEIGKTIKSIVAKNNKIKKGSVQAFRYGGEEFAVIFKNKSTEESKQILKEISLGIKENKKIQSMKPEYVKQLAEKKKTYNPEEIGLLTKWEETLNRHGKFTISAGLADFSNVKENPKKSFFNQADMALNKAKEAGRNTIIVAS